MVHDSWKMILLIYYLCISDGSWKNATIKTHWKSSVKEKWSRQQSIGGYQKWKRILLWLTQRHQNFYINFQIIAWVTVMLVVISGLWWPKWPKPSTTSYSCHQHISSPTSVTNIDAIRMPLDHGAPLDLVAPLDHLKVNNIIFNTNCIQIIHCNQQVFLNRNTNSSQFWWFLDIGFVLLFSKVTIRNI